MQSLDNSMLHHSPLRKNTESSKNDISINCDNLDDSPFLPPNDDIFLNINTRKSESTTILPKDMHLIEEKIIQNSSDNDIINKLRQENKKIHMKLKETREKLLKSEEKSYEYYELYHKLIYENKKNDQERLQILKENVHIKNQLSILRSYIAKVERKLTSLAEKNEKFCEFEIKDNNWGKGYIVKNI